MDEIKFEPIDNFGEVMTIEEFINACDTQCLIDYDGFGKYATKKMMSNLTIVPSDVLIGDVLQGFSHIVWYNR